MLRRRTIPRAVPCYYPLTTGRGVPHTIHRSETSSSSDSDELYSTQLYPYVYAGARTLRMPNGETGHNNMDLDREEGWSWVRRLRTGAPTNI